MNIEPERDHFFQYATFTILGATLLVCLCYTLIFLNPRVNPVVSLRPPSPTVDSSVAELPATWTPTDTATPTSTSTDTPTPTPTNTDTPTPTDTDTPTETPTDTATFTPLPPTATPRPPTRRPVTETPLPSPTNPPPTVQAYDFILGREPDRLPNCGTWYVSGTVYNNGSGSQRLNGIPVRIWAYGIEQGTDTTGVHGGRTGYWEWVFGKGSNVDGEVAVVNPDGSLRSPRIPFNLQSACNDNNVNQVVIDFVGTH